ncbi:MAG: hypothetical protein ACLQVL_23460 [Terriglobia bacterium]
MISENLAKTYVIETKIVISIVGAGREKRGGEMQVSSIMLLKTNVQKMSEIDLSIMLMKTKLVIVISPLCV